MLFLGVYFIQVNAMADQKDSVRTILSIEYGRLKGISDYDLTQMKPNPTSIKTHWSCYGLRIHQGLNQFFQINSGVLFQTLNTNSIPQLHYSFPTERSYSRDQINFIQIPIGLTTMVNLYKRKMYLGLYFSINLNYLSKNFKEFATDYSQFQNNKFIEQYYFVNQKFYASQEVGLSYNYFFNERIRLRFSYNLTIENGEPIIASDRFGTSLTQGSTYIFDGSGTKLNFQLGYTLFKNKSFMETKHESDSALSNLL
jgi:hypothetical protein